VDNEGTRWSEWNFDPVDLEIEGASCFLVATVSSIPEGSYWIEIEFRGLNESDPQREASVFVLSNPGALEFVALVSGVLIAVAGGVFIGMGRRPSQESHSHEVQDRPPPKG
jgi:hypothetical protein